MGAEVEEDGVRIPAAESADGGLVDTRDEEGGGSTRAEAVGFNTVRRDVGDVVDSGGCAAKFEGDVAGGDVMRMVGGIVVVIQGAVGGGMVLEKVLDTSLDGADGAEVGVTREAMAKGLPTCAVLLIGVGKGDVCPLLHVIPRTGTGGDALESRAAERCVGETEGLAAATVGGGRQGVFPGSAEEVEGESAQVEDGLGTGLGLGRGWGEGLDQGTKDRDVDGPDTGGSRVLISPGFEEGLEAEDVVGAFQPGVREAQSGERLPHGTEGLLHALSADGVRASREQATAVAAGKDDEELEMGVGRDIAEIGVLLEVGGESHPRGEQMVSVGPGRNHDAVAGRLRCSEEIRAESVTVGRWYMRQGSACGKRELKRVSNCASDKSWRRERMSAMVLASPAMWETS